MNYDIVIYGGGLGAYCSAMSASKTSPSKSICMIIPCPTAMVGGIATAGGQNFWDDRGWNGTVQQGTYTHNIKTLCAARYNTDTMSSALRTQLLNRGNITLKMQYDITSYTSANNPYRITSVQIKNIYRDGTGNVVYGSNSETIGGTVFIDASEDGKLARVANPAVTTGRFDFPSARLDSKDQSVSLTSRQQAATLMFKMKNIHTYDESDLAFEGDNTNGWCCYGGKDKYNDPTSKIYAFNNKYGSQGYILKPINSAQNGPGSSEWWINAFLMFDIDGRAHSRDKGTSMFPTMISGMKTVDEAWIEGRQFLSEHEAEIRNAFRELAGFENADFVFDTYGYPVVGDIPYIRETVHMTLDSGNRTHGSENTNYAVTTSEANNAGSTNYNGTDSSNAATSIGLAYYNSDLHPYKLSDIKTGSSYLWNGASYSKIRPDLGLNDNTPANPVLIPYSALTTNYVANLLIPGYAVGVSSFAWGEVRVFPNLCVLGDAAGVAAAYCITNNKQPLYLSSSDINTVRNKIVAAPIYGKISK